jgi:amino acid adenylation domain-containing protein/thioester reductase-like protein
MEQTERYPLSHPQKGIYYMEKFYPNSSLGNVIGTLTLKGDFNVELFSKAINAFIKKNDAMRLRIVEEDGIPKQYISEYTEKQFAFFDFTDSPDRWKEWLNSRNTVPFTIVNSDLYYFAIIRLDNLRGAVYLKIHHLISDAWSLTYMANKIMEYYSALKNGSGVEEAEAPSYIDYINKEIDYKSSRRFIKDRDFWLSRFVKEPEAALLKQRFSKHVNTAADRKTFVISKDLTQEIHLFCKKEHLSVFMLLASVFTLYLSRVSGKEDVTLVTMVLNRSSAEEKNTMGMFISTLPVRISVNDKLRFIDFAQNVGKEWMGLLRHQRYPYDILFEELRKQHGMQHTLFDTAISYQNAKLNKQQHDEIYETEWHFNGHSINAFTMHINDRENEGNLIIDYDFLKEMFSEDEVESIHKNLITLLKNSMVNPLESLGKLELLSEEEKQKILYEFNNCNNYFESSKTIQELFEEVADKMADCTAAVFDGKSITYSELNGKANQLARLLRIRGLKQHSIAGIMVERSLEMLIGLLAVLKAGGAYLPIDPDFPEERIKYMLNDSRAKFFLTQSDFKDIAYPDMDMIYIDDEAIYCGDSSNPINSTAASNLACVLYTSGSTGKPKGVMVEHKNILSYIIGFIDEFNVTSEDVVLQQASFTFDVFMEEVFSALLTGGKVVIPKHQQILDIYSLHDFLRRYSITLVSCSPFLLKELNKLPPVQSVRLFISGGDVLKYKYVSSLINYSTVYNTYGPTETTICASYYKVTAGCSHNIPIGKPTANSAIYILDKYNNLQPIGAPGELCITGSGVTGGYINNRDLTLDKFVENPFTKGKMMYRTGDLARWLPGGNLEFLGRMDHQVKIRGFRVETGEVETQLLKHELINETIILAKENTTGSKYLCAYFCSSGEPSIKELREYLSKSLPEYMIPSYFVQIDTLPLTTNGKVDINCLPEPQYNFDSQENYVPPESFTEEKIAAVWSEVLEIEKVGTKDDFFELGGDSLKAIIIVSKLMEDFDIEINDIFECRTIGELAKRASFNKGNLKIKVEEAVKSIKINRTPETRRKHQRILNQAITSYVNSNRLYRLKPLSGRIRYNSILLTGTTGYLGVYLLHDLLTRTSSSVYVLLRNTEEKKTEDRLTEKLAFYFGSRFYERYKNRIYVVGGDLAQENLGIDQNEYERLSQQIDCIINCAAYVKHYGHYKDFYETNVKGVENLGLFAALGLKKALNHISTISIAHGKQQEESIIYLSEYDICLSNDTSNYYLKSKLEAEKLLIKLREKGISVNIFRTGNIVFSSGNGKFQENIEDNAFYSQIKAFIKLGVMPISDEKTFDFSYVDYVSNSIIRLFDKVELQNEVYHIVNPNRVSLHQIGTFLRNTGIKIKLINTEDFLQYLLDNINTPELKEYVTSLLVHSHVLENPKSTRPIILSRKTEMLLGRLGFTWPRLSVRDVNRMINYCRKIKFI